MHDVFISFSFADQEKAEYICNRLMNQYHISCWICTQDIDGGQKYRRLIPQAIRDSKIVVFLQSAASLKSEEIPKEFGISIRAGKTIIPFLLDNSDTMGSELEYELEGIEYIDATVPPFDERIRDLAETISRHIGIPLADHKAAEASAAPVLASSKIVCSQIFFGRDDVMEQIGEAFQSRDVVFLHGMGGIGKSEIARQYWRRNRDFYTTVVFARYGNSLASLIADDAVFKMKGVSRKTKSDNTSQTDEEYAEDKLKVLKRNADSHTLIVIDNYDVVSDPFFEKLDEGGSYRILVTSRCEPERGKYPVIPVSEIDDAGLRRLFIEYANPNRTMIDEDDPAFPELFELTNRHTLTLELTAKYMDEKGMDEIGEIVRLFREKKLEALSDSEKKDGYAVIRNLFRMTGLCEQEKLFMRCLAMMPPAGVNQRMFRKWIGEAFSARSRLADLSLIRVDVKAKSLALHPVVRDIVLNELKPSYENCRGFLDNFADDIDEKNSWNWQLPVKIHAVACADGILELFPIINEENFQLIYLISILKNFVQGYSEVMPLHEKLYQYCMVARNELSLGGGLVAFRAGWLCKKLMLLDKAALWLEERAYPALKAHFDECLVEFPHCCTNICTLYIKKYEIDGIRKNLEIADKYLSEAEYTTVDNYHAVSETDNPDEKMQLFQHIAGVKMEQAELLIKEGQFDKAIDTLNDAQTILLSNPDNTADMAYLTSKYAAVYFSQGNYQKARESLEKTIDLYQKVFSEANDYSLNVNIMLAECYEKLEMIKEANQTWKNALEIAEKGFEQDHPIIQMLKGHLALNV